MQGMHFQTNKTRTFLLFFQLVDISHGTKIDNYRLLRGYSQKGRVVWRPLAQTLTPPMTKVWDFSLPIYDMAKNLTPYL